MEWLWGYDVGQLNCAKGLLLFYNCLNRKCKNETTEHANGLAVGIENESFFCAFPMRVNKNLTGPSLTMGSVTTATWHDETINLKLTCVLLWKQYRGFDQHSFMATHYFALHRWGGYGTFDSLHLCFSCSRLVGIILYISFILWPINRSVCLSVCLSVGLSLLSPNLSAIPLAILPVGRVSKKNQYIHLSADSARTTEESQSFLGVNLVPKLFHLPPSLSSGRRLGAERA